MGRVLSFPMNRAERPRWSSSRGDPHHDYAYYVEERPGVATRVRWLRRE